MKILAISDEQYPAYYEQYVKGRLKGYDLIISCGDLRGDYLSFIVTVSGTPLLYVPGNHDGSYEQRPPDGCDCIDDKLVVYRGLRILGLGGSRRYHPGPHQYTDKEMRKRIRRLRRKLWWHGGVDIVVTHAPPEGVGDCDDHAHRGFGAFLKLLDKYKPRYLLHGHTHINYSHNAVRERQYGDTQVINVCQRYELEIPDDTIKPTRKKGDLKYLNLKH